ncbi:hypothetical protein ACK3TF_005372 [Chlorella vulgaris]
MSDLWGYGDDEPEPDHFSDSSDDRRKKRSDTEEADLLPEKKRRKLQQLGCNVGRSGRRGRRAARGTAASQLDTAGTINLDSDEDSDRQLLREAGRGATASGAAAPSAAAAAAANGTAAPRAALRQGNCGAGLDPRSAALLQQAHAIQQRLKAAQEDVLSDDDSESLEPSPAVVRGAAAVAAAAREQRRQQQQQQQQAGGQGGAVAGGDVQCDLDLTGDASDGDSAGLRSAAAGSEGGERPAASPGAGGLQPAGSEADRIALKLRSARHGEKVLRMRSCDPFSKLFAAYRGWAAEQGHIASADAAVRFIFDGDCLLPGQTPADLDLEGDECIDVHC